MNMYEPVATQRATILAVDDAPDNLEVLGHLLYKHYDVLAATSGERALQIVAGEPKPDLILLDVLMPGIDGYATLACLRENPATRYIPVIFVTGLDSADEEEKGLELGAVDYITKPYRLPVVLARIHTQLELKRARDWLANQNIYLEAEVARREAVLHLVTTAARDAIVMADGEGRVAFWNPAAEQIFGYAAEEVLGRELHYFLTPERFRADAAQGLSKFRTTGTGAVVGKTIELAALHKNGTEIPMEISFEAIQRDDAWWGVAILRDLSARKALDAQLAQAQQQLLQADKLVAIGILAAGVAHEINNPLSFITFNINSLGSYVRDILEVLDSYEKAATADSAREAALAKAIETRQEKDLDYLRSDVEQLIAQSQDGLERVRTIVRDLKSFAHIKEDNWQWTDLHSRLDSTLNIVRNQLKYHCTVHRDYGDPPEVWCLPEQLSQVFLNMLVNAGHAIEGQGDITIRTGRQGEEVFVAITDTGRGISAENLPRLFEPFFTTKPVGQGTGLGLSVAWGIVQKHQGRIEVESTPGKGTTFTVLLPLRPPGESAERG